MFSSSTLKILFLYLTTVCIWGSTWLAIQYQLGVVSPVWSVAYRFGFAGLILMAFSLLTKRSLRFSLRQHGLLLALGFLLFSLNYLFYYWGSSYFISGIVAIIFASVSLFNIVHARIYFKTPLSKRVIGGAIVGLCGLLLISWAEISVFYRDLQSVSFEYIGTGLLLCMVGTFLASCGQMMATAVQKKGLPILQSNAWGMLYGGLFTVLEALILQQPIAFDFSWPYVGSLCYLTVFGSVLAFSAYCSLIGRIGPERASYAFVLLPFVSMGISSWAEGFIWSPSVACGVLLILFGNFCVLRKETVQKKVEIS